MHGILLILGACCLFASCKRPAPTNAVASPEPHSTLSPHKVSPGRNYEAGPAKFDVCALLKSGEIRAIAGSSIEQSNGSERSDGSLRISQCVYLASPANRSVSLVVTESDSAAKQKRSARDFWQERFGRYRRQGGEEEEEVERKSNSGEGEREGRPPRKIEGLGEEAFWTAGSLYVSQKDLFLRLSVGGADSEETKLEHSRALAAIALKRLQPFQAR